MDPQLKSLFEAATRAYLGAGIYAWKFSRGKLRRDPVFFSLLRRGLLPDRGNLYDLGCGQGVLLLREADAGAGLPFQITQWAERIIGMGRGRLWQKLYYRQIGEWISLLQEIGFSVTTEPMSEGTPFANILFVAKK